MVVYLLLPRIYHISTARIIKLFPIKVFLPASNFPWLATLTKGTLVRSLVNLRSYWKKPTAQIKDFAFRKKGRGKTMVKVEKSCHQVTDPKKWQKRESSSKLFDFKIFRCE